MYLDETIELNFKMPTTLKNLLIEIDAAYENNQEFEFSMKLEMVEATAKQCKVNYAISEQELHLIFCKYGLR